MSSKPDETAPRRTVEIASRPLDPGLYLVATPIGNLRDISLRALDILASVDVVACEDTRVSRRLLDAYGLNPARVAYHDHNGAEMRPRLISRIKGGESVALISDAGTPLISDPGFKLVRAAVAEGLAVTSVPGASAVLTGLSLAGLPTDRFLFAGFLPAKAGARTSGLEDLRALDATLVFFESGRRLAESLAAMAAVLGDRPAAVARELTKLHEEVRRGRLRTLAEETVTPPKGEIVVVVGPPEGAKTDVAGLDDLLRGLLADSSVKTAVAEAVAATGLPKRVVYARALVLADER